MAPRGGSYCSSYGPKPGKRQRPYATCSAGSNCTFGGWKYYPIPHMCKCGAAWDGGAKGNTTQQAPAPKNGKAAPKTAAGVAFEEMFWERAQNSEGDMEAYKGMFGADS